MDDAGRADAHHRLHRRSGFLCGTEGLQLSSRFQRSLGAGIFGGDGFLLQRLSGPCTAWVELGGEGVTYDLAPGEMLQVHPGHIGMFQAQHAGAGHHSSDCGQSPTEGGSAASGLTTPKQAGV